MGSVKKKKIAALLMALILLICSLTAGCGAGTEEESTQASSSGNRIYYLASDGVTFISEEYTMDTSLEADEIALDMMECLLNPSSSHQTSVVPDTVTFEGVYCEDGIAVVMFSTAYGTLGVTERSLCNAGIVFTLCQIDGVSSVAFMVDGVVESDAEGNAVTWAPSNFSSTSDEVMELYSVETVTLYLTDSSGNGLKAYDIEGAFPINTSMEQHILDLLIGWEDTADYISPIPDGTTVLSVQTQDSVCYVNFSSDFLNTMVGVSQEVTLFSVVNSLTQLSYVSYVYVTVEGSSDVTMGSITLGSALSSNWDYLIQEE
ncbi:MAG: GerMN domain-containing protein [Lachnospiraceae bacterium]|nr:GerMN domain-containing protein [Lachnospiraceae bacterium]